MIYRHAVFARFEDQAAAQQALERVTSGASSGNSKVLPCNQQACSEQILSGLMSNSTWAESDGRRGLLIGLVLGTLLGAIMGYVLFSILEMPVMFGLVLGTAMGSLVGALMSGIVGAGLVNPRLKTVVRNLEVGQAVMTASFRSRAERERAIALVQDQSLEVTANC